MLHVQILNKDKKMFSDVTVYYYKVDNINGKVYTGMTLDFLPIKGMLLTFIFGTVHVNKVEVDITSNKLYLKVTPSISLSDEYNDNL